MCTFCQRKKLLSTCIFFTPLQAQARCHRIGQNKPVKVYRLITRNSYEREMFDRSDMTILLDLRSLICKNVGYTYTYVYIQSESEAGAG